MPEWQSGGAVVGSGLGGNVDVSERRTGGHRAMVAVRLREAELVRDARCGHRDGGNQGRTAGERTKRRRAAQPGLVYCQPFRVPPAKL